MKSFIFILLFLCRLNLICEYFRRELLVGNFQQGRNHQKNFLVVRDFSQEKFPMGKFPECSKGYIPRGGEFRDKISAEGNIQHDLKSHRISKSSSDESMPRTIFQEEPFARNCPWGIFSEDRIVWGITGGWYFMWEKPGRKNKFFLLKVRSNVKNLSEHKLFCIWGDCSFLNASLYTLVWLFVPTL